MYGGLDNDSASTKHFSNTGRIDKRKMIRKASERKQSYHDL